MTPVDDERDRESAKEWGLEPPIPGDFRRGNRLVVLLFRVPVAAFILGLSLHQLAHGSIGVPFAFGLNLGGGLLVAGLIRGFVPSQELSVQLGRPGIAIARAGYFGGRYRAAWIEWSDPRFSRSASGDTLGR